MAISEKDQKIIDSLEKPGAGLPFVLSKILKWYIGPVISKKTRWDENAAYLQKEYQKITTRIEGIPLEKLSERALIKRIPGLEDSSRYWSIAMTLEHMLIVGKGMKHAIIEISHNRVPPMVADTAKVKPLGLMPVQEVVDEFKEFFSTVLADIESKVGDKASPTQYQHPWFGPIDAHQWFWVLGIHQSIHRKQIQLIKEQVLAKA